MNTETRVRRVGVDLQDSEDTRLLVEAMEADNPGVTVSQIPGIVKDKISAKDLITNDLIDAINRFDASKVAAEAKAYK